MSHGRDAAQRARAAALLAVAAVLAGCAPAARVTLLPQPAGTPSAVNVTSGQGTAVLAKPYESAAVVRGNIDIEQLDARTVQRRYGRLLSVAPGATERFALYFMTGTSELTPESSAELAGVLSHALSLPGGEIIVVGHTDRVGSGESNDALSLHRAQAVRELLIGRGFNPARVYAVGRGEREPLVPTADEVDEPRNRRVEIVVR